jgi:hypothetical protein
MDSEDIDLKKRIDSDTGLRAKRKHLTIVAIIMLGIQFSGAKLEEANTFILKFSFAHQNGIAFLLLMAILFLLVRYYNYASPYHDELFKKWSDRLLHEPLLYSYCPHSTEQTGLIIDIAENKLNINMETIKHSEYDTLDWEYKCRLLFVRYIIYSIGNRHETYTETINLFKNVSIRNYLKILSYEFKYQLSSFFIHRENLDILAPYLLALSAMCSYFYADKIQYFL